MTVKNKKSEKKSKVKFTLANLLHRIKKLKITANVVIDDMVVEDYPVSWVKVRGAQDPVYLQRSSEYMEEYKDTVIAASEEEDEDTRNKILAVAVKRFQSLSVACAIEDWDKEFFGTEFEVGVAIDLFQKKENFLIYNQIATYIQKSIDFLPNASQPQ